MLGCWAPHTSATLTCRWFLGYITYLYVSAVVDLGMPYHRTTDVSHDLLTYLRILLCVLRLVRSFLIQNIVTIKTLHFLPHPHLLDMSYLTK